MAFSGDDGAAIKVIQSQWKHTDNEGHLFNKEPELSLMSLARSTEQKTVIIN